MTQRDKVKELVGRGLNSYHTKSLQQIDRIEKKNKEQNHKISILSNELDNDYLTKTEEGSVVSLEHSKEGMIYLDELQGNTLVNYCTDGSKEMTLNGDIDLEGTFITTTEGVDNGLVDVMCEGNTLVNLISKNWNYGTFETKNNRECLKIEKTLGNSQHITNVKSGSTYTLIYDYISTELINGTTNPFGRLHLTLNNQGAWVYDVPVKNFGSNNTQFTRSISVFTIPTDKQFTTLNVSGVLRDIDGTVWIDKEILLLEGDWSNKELPSYFEGMKSVGQDDENGHKIEILSQNKNYIDLTKKIDTTNGARMVIEDDVVTLTSIGSYSWCYNGIKLNHLKPNTKYICKGIVEGGNPQSTFRVHDFNGAISTTFKNSLVFTTPSDVSGLCLLFYISTSSPCETGETAVFKNIQLEKSENSTDYVKRQSNKKEILLNEPLRSIENINKDRIVKIGNKLFIERNLAQITLDGTENWIKWSYETPLTQLDTHLHCTIRIANIKYYSKECANLITDKFKSVSTRGALGEHIYHDGWNDTICIKILQSKLETPDVSGFKKWLQNNPIELIYELATPIYEPLEIEPILNTYTDITHISNNSIIPCNMKVKNSGYNVIIKPSTLYTVALYTNKSGTIGMNLGGVKGTTTNNVLTLTTPATLTDDSLRLHGKGIKGSKVRLLEGDKTNWIPSHFEGMQSSFEDKFDTTDNTYKMEILSNNKNLMNFEVARGYSDNWEAVEGTDVHEAMRNKYPIQVKPNTKYCVEVETTHVDAKFYVRFFDENKKYIGGSTLFTYEKGGKYSSVFTSLNDKRVKYMNIHQWSSTKISMDTLKYIKVAESSVIIEIPKHKSNKIQFSSIEPLRSVDNTKDKFVFKDNKLMIERNCGAFKINSSQGFIRVSRYDNGYLYGFEKDFDEIKRTLQSNKIIKCDKLPYYPYSGGDITMKNINGEWIGTWSDGTTRSVIMLRLKTKDNTLNSLNEYLKENPIEIAYIKTEPTYEEIPFELQKIILEGYESGTLFIDTNIPPTVTTTYAGETPIVKSVRLNKTEVLNNTTDINDNIIPYLMDMDYRVVCLELATETQGISMARLFGGVYEMLKRDILSGRLSKEEYGYRLADYFNAGKLTEEQVRELEGLR